MGPCWQRIDRSKGEAFEGGGCKEDPEGQGRPWAEDRKPTQCQHQRSGPEHLPSWSKGLLLRSLCRPLRFRSVLYCPRTDCRPVRKCEVRLQREGGELWEADELRSDPGKWKWKPDERLHPGQQRPDPDRQSSKWRRVHRQLQPVLLRSPERAVR